MAEEVYSKPLNPAAKEKLVAFVEACIDTLASQYVDETNDRAKRLGRDVLEIDIDILTFLTTIASMYSPGGQRYLFHVINGHLQQTHAQAAKIIVEVAEQARKIDKSSRTS